MSGWFTTWTFWVGATWGGSVVAIASWYWLVKPMGELLGFDKAGAAKAAQPGGQGRE